MTRINRTTPFLHVPDLRAALSFFCETLPFELKFRQSDYAYIELDGCGLRMLEEPPMDKSWKMREFQVRLPDGDWLTFGHPIP